MLGRENTEASVQSPSVPKSVVWSPMDGVGETEQDPLLRGIPKVLLELLPRRVLLY